jgi:hypothetical protein
MSFSRSSKSSITIKVQSTELLECASTRAQLIEWLQRQCRIWITPQYPRLCSSLQILTKKEKDLSNCIWTKIFRPSSLPTLCKRTDNKKCWTISNSKLPQTTSSSPIFKKQTEKLSEPRSSSETWPKFLVSTTAQWTYSSNLSRTRIRLNLLQQATRASTLLRILGLPARVTQTVLYLCSNNKFWRVDKPSLSNCF